jgi:AP2-associated kinase
MKKLVGKIGNPVPSSSASQSSCIGKSFTLGKLTVSVEEVIAEGGFGVVFLAKHGAQKYALKRILVNNDQDLAVGTREIQFMVRMGSNGSFHTNDRKFIPLFSDFRRN